MDKNYLSTDATEQESEKLFPDIQSPVKRGVVRKADRVYLGMNPYTALQEQEKHRQHLADLEAELQRKEAANDDMLEAKKAAVAGQLNPIAEKKNGGVNGDEEEIDGESPILVHARKRNPLLPSSDSVAVGSMKRKSSKSAVVAASNDNDKETAAAANSNIKKQITSGALMDASNPFPTYDPMTKEKDEELMKIAWPGKATNQQQQQQQLAITNTSTATTGTTAPSEQLSEAQQKIAKHRSYFNSAVTSPSTGVMVPFPFEEHMAGFTGGDDGDDAAAAGSGQQQPEAPQETIVLDRSITIDDTILQVMFGNTTVKLPKCTKTFSGSVGQKTLKCTLSGKPPLPWNNDKVTVEVFLSSYSKTTKSVVVSSYMRAVPHLMSKFGLPVAHLWSFMPFNLRMQVPDTFDANVACKYVGKQQLRSFNATTKLPICGGRVMTEATITVSGFASSTAPKSGTLELALVDDPANLSNFKFKKISLLLGFLDAFPLSNIRLTTATHNKSFTVAADWKLLEFQAIRRILGDEDNIHLTGQLAVDRLIRFKTERGRQHVLWSIFKVENAIGFLESCDGVCQYGIDCQVIATISQNDLVFSGRFESRDEPPKSPQMFFSGSLQGIWNKCYGFDFLTMTDVVISLGIHMECMHSLEGHMTGSLCVGDLVLPTARVQYSLEDLNKHMLVAQIKNLSWGEFIAALGVESSTFAGIDEDDNENETASKPQRGLVTPPHVLGIMNTFMFEEASFNLNPNLKPLVVNELSEKRSYRTGFSISIVKATFAGYVAAGEMVMSKDASTIIGCLTFTQPICIGPLRLRSRTPDGRGPILCFCSNVERNKPLAVNNCPIPNVDDADDPLLKDGLRFIANVDLLDVSYPCVVEVGDNAISIAVQNCGASSVGSSTSSPSSSPAVSISLVAKGVINTDYSPVSTDGIDGEHTSLAPTHFSFDQFELLRVGEPSSPFTIGGDHLHENHIKGFADLVRTSFKSQANQLLAEEEEELREARERINALEISVRDLSFDISSKSKSFETAVSSRIDPARAVEELREYAQSLRDNMEKKRRKVSAALTSSSASTEQQAMRKEKYSAQLGWLSMELHATTVQSTKADTIVKQLEDVAVTNNTYHSEGIRAALRASLTAARQRVKQVRLRCEALQRGIASFAATYHLKDDCALFGTISQTQMALSLACSARLGEKKIILDEDDESSSSQKAYKTYSIAVGHSLKAEALHHLAEKMATAMVGGWVDTLTPPPQYEENQPAEETL